MKLFLLRFCDGRTRVIRLAYHGCCEPRYYIFYKRNSYTSSTILFLYVLTTEMKTTNGNKKNTAHFYKATEISKI